MLRRTLLTTAAATLAAPAILRAQTGMALDFYYPIAVGGPLAAILDEYCRQFRDETGITVTPTYAGNYSEALTKAMIALRAGKGPHLAVLLAAEMHGLQDSGTLAPLDALGPVDAAWIDSFYPAFLANSRAAGKVWSVPFQRSTAIAYYNKTAFKESGLDPDAFPTTWAGLQEAGQRLTKKDPSGRVTRWGLKMASDLGNAQWTFGALANQAGARLMNDAGTETYFTDPKVVGALAYWRGLTTAGASPEGVSAWPTLSPDFLEGNTAIIWHTTGNLTNLRDKASFPFGVAGLPGKESPHTVVGGGNLYFFNQANTAERAAALRFARWLTTPDRAADWSIRTGYIATSPAAYETKALTEYVAKFPAAGVAKSYLPVATGELSTYENQRVYKLLTDNIQTVLGGSLAPAQAMATVQEAADRLLKPYRT
jgi:sn-glycerol 3-phosphate transport system substrate-binding protein